MALTCMLTRSWLTPFKAHLSIKRARIPAQRNRTKAPSTQALFSNSESGGKGKGGRGSGAAICKDCGYIEVNFAAASAQDGYRCPVCNAPKRRFVAYAEPVSRNINSTATRKARKADLQTEPSGGGVNPAVIASLGVALLVALYVGLNAAV